jgi:hypothetical protein
LELVQASVNSDVISEAKRRCKSKLEKTPLAKIPITKIIAELEADIPRLPRFRVERAAYLNYCGRNPKDDSDKSEIDWISAEKQLREEYKNPFR